MFKRIVAVAALLSGVIPTYQAWAQPRAGSPAQHRPLPDFDTRDAAPAPAAAPDRDQTNRIVETRRRTLQSFLSSPSGARSGIRIAPNRFGLPKTYTREGRPLTAPSTADPQDIARDFLRANRSLFPLTPTEISALRLVTKDASSSAVFLTFNQTLNGIDVFDGQIKLTLTAAGEIVHAGADQVVPGLSLSTNPQLTVTQAVSAAMANAGVTATLPAPAVAEGKTTFRNPRGERYSPITAELFIFPMDAAAARLAYRIFLEADNDCWYEMLIDAQTGDLLLRHNLYTHATQARVWVQSPLDTDRQLVTFPDAWLPANATVTTGNNVDAYLDANGDDKPDNTTTGPLNNGRASASNQIFDFPFGDGMTNQNPRSFQAAAVTNLFYLINIAHDYYYKLGFTEASGNFQTDNFGKGGLANDAVIAEAQQPSELDNASFAPTVDGTAPKIRMGIFTNDTATQTDDLDSSYDGMVVVHEYGHGVSNRLVGSRNSVSCLNGIQSGAMGEGWSDYFAISYFNNPVQGAYLARDPVNGFRRHSYEGYPYTYEDIGNEGLRSSQRWRNLGRYPLGSSQGPRPDRH
jgi:Zn-dependent metalloprotease